MAEFDYGVTVGGELYLTYDGRPVFSAESDCEWVDIIDELARLLNKFVAPHTRSHSHIIRDWNGGDPPYLIG